MTKTFEVRAETGADRAAVGEVLRAAFPTDAEARLVEALRDGGALALSLVAEEGGQIVGHIAFSELEVGEAQAATTPPGLALAPVAVLPECQRRGLGAALVGEGLRRLAAARRPFVIVLGHAEYYPRFGFAPASRYGILCPFPAPDEAFLALELNPGGLQGVTGTVCYRPEFGQM